MPVPPSLPAHVAQLASALAGLPGVSAVVLGGSRAAGAHRPDSDWDLGLYYRRSECSFDPALVRSLGHDGYVSELGEWGPVMHGGAWLTVEDTPVDVLFRDLDTVDPWLADAEQGRFDVLRQNGYLAGAPTYQLVGELAICRPISGELPRPAFPTALAASAPTWWNGRAGVSLLFATTHARAADTTCCTGMLVDAALCAAHARLAQRGEWVLNEKRLLQRAGLEEIHALVAHPGTTAPELSATVTAVAELLEIQPLAAR